VDIGDHPGLGDSIDFPHGSMVGDEGSAVVVACAGATKMVVIGYTVNDLND
jgi:hypothetical protein